MTLHLGTTTTGERFGCVLRGVGMTRLRLWWATRRNPKCDGGWPYGEQCDRPSVAGVLIMGWPQHVCEWHLEPLTEDRPLAFLGRWIGLTT